MSNNKTLSSLPMEADWTHDEIFNITSPDLLSNETEANTTEAATRDEDLAKIEVTVLAIIFVLALVSNGIVILALSRQLRRKPSSRMYQLMFHLSVADLLVAIFNVLPQLIWDITDKFYGPSFLCPLVKFGQIFPLYLSSFVLTLMAVDRVGVTKQKIAVSGRKNLVPYIMVVWIMAVILALPQIFIFSKSPRSLEGDSEMDCWAHFGPHKFLEQAYTVVFILIVFILPFLVISLSYCVVTKRIWSYSKTINRGSDDQLGDSNAAMDLSYRSLQGASSGAGKSLGDGEDEEVATVDTAVYEMKVLRVEGGEEQQVDKIRGYEDRSQRSDRETPGRSSAPGGPYKVHTNQIVLLSKAKKKSLEMTATVSICFAVCWLPWTVAMLLMVFEAPLGDTDMHPVIVILTLLASLNSTTNPWIYLCFSSAVLQQVKHIVGMRSTLGGPDSLGGADADRAEPPGQRHAKRIQFRRPRRLQMANGGAQNPGVDLANGSGPGNNLNQFRFQRPLYRRRFQCEEENRQEGCLVRSEP